MKINTIIFDYNGLLADDLKIHQECYEEIARRYRPGVKREDIEEILPSLSTREKIEFILGKGAPEERVEGIVREKEGLYIKKVRGMDILFPGAGEVINSLAGKYTLAILSNTTRKQLMAGVPEELARKFACIMTHEEVEKSRQKPKPAPDSLFRIMETLGKKPEECCYVGDSPVDMQTAVNAGIVGIGIPSWLDSKEDLIKAGAFRVIGNIRELPALLEQLSRTEQFIQ